MSPATAPLSERAALDAWSDACADAAEHTFVCQAGCTFVAPACPEGVRHTQAIADTRSRYHAARREGLG